MIQTSEISSNGHGNSNGVSSMETGAQAAVNLILPKAEELASLNVHQRVRWIIAESRSLPKSQWNPQGAFAYAGHDQVIDMLRLLLAKYGVNIYQEPLEFKRDATLGGVAHFTTVKYEYEVINADNPEDSFVRHNWGEAIDDGDKGLNKCSTIAERMFLLRLFKLATYDDPDAHSPKVQSNGTTPQNGTGRMNHQQTVRQSGNECQQCGELITKATRQDKMWQRDEVIAISKKKFGKRLCVDCFLSADSASRHESANGKPVTQAQGNGKQETPTPHPEPHTSATPLDPARPS